MIGYDLTERSGGKKYRKYEKNCLFHTIKRYNNLTNAIL